MPGWLGASTPEEFLQAQQHTDMPCHVTVDYEDPAWELSLDEAATCYGGLVYLRNTTTLPRDGVIAERVRSVEKSDDVFARGKEFVDHHRSLGVGSWDHGV